MTVIPPNELSATVKPLYSGAVGPVRLSDQLETEYEELYGSMILRDEYRAEVASAATRAVAHQNQYATVADHVGVPWWWIACVHQLESGANFHTHLHNGDSLSARTVHVPAGRPLNGNPPFRWEDSAIDALQYEKLDQWDQWDLAGSLFQMEKYNGFGYRRRGVHTPYLWSGSYWYVKGKFVADDRYDPEAVSKEIGCAVLLHRLVDTGVVQLPG